MRPLVSIVLAAHDAEATIGLAVGSLLRQTLREIELVVVEDYSSDGTRALLEGIRDDRLVVLRNDTQLGLASSLNRGLERASARYVARLDADDVALPSRLERQLHAMRMRAELGVLGTGVLELRGRRPGQLHVMPRGDGIVRWHALFSAPFLHPTVMLDRELLERHGLRYDPACLESEDYDLWARLLRHATGDNLPEPLVLYRRHSGQASERRRDLQRSVQRQVGLRQIAEVAPALDPEAAELAWLLGAGESVPAEYLSKAADAFVMLLHEYERRRGRDRGVRRATAAILAGAALRASGARSRILRLALQVDPALPLHVSGDRRRRRTLARAAKRESATWLQLLRSAVAPHTAEPVRVAAVFAEPAPYRSSLLDRLEARPELDLTVIYGARTVAQRRWEVSPRHRHVVLRGLRLPGARRILLHDYPLSTGVWRALDRIEPDVVVAQGWSTFAAQAAVVWARRRGVPYVLQTESNERDPRRTWRRVVKDAVLPRLVRGAAGVLVTGTLARESMERRGARGDRIRVFAATVDVRAFGERADRLAGRRAELRQALGLEDEDVAVLYVGRLVPEKGIATLVRAMAAARDRRLVLVVAGEGPQREALEQLVARLGVRAIFAGDLPWERIVEAYAAADVFALLSTHEPWGVVVIEAAACGLPLVVSEAVGAAPDLVRPGENGEVVPGGDVEAAAAALRRLAADPELRARQGVSSRRIAANWGYEPSIAGFLELTQLAALDRVGD